jgi:hypothetical protein
MGKLLERRLEPSEAQDTLRVIRQAEATQPNNGVWPMAEATLRWSLKDIKGAESSWQEAYRCTTYDDLQADRWIEWRQSILRQPGGTIAWPWAWIQPNRSARIAQAIGSYGRWRLLQSQKLEGTAVTRAETLLIARRLRDGSRSVQAGLVGARLVEGATYPSMLRTSTNPKRLVTARAEMVDALKNEGRSDLGAMVDDVLKDNEGWLAFVESSDYRENARFWALAAVASASLPSALLVASLSGLIVLGIAALVRIVPSLPQIMRVSLAGALALLMGGVAWGLSGLPMPTLVSASCALFLLVGPKQVRSHAGTGLGPLHEVLTFLLGLFWLATFGLFLAGLTQASQAVLPLTGVPASAYGGSATLASLAWLVVAIVIGMVPLWAAAQRVPVKVVLFNTLEIFGRSVFVGGLVLATLAGFLAAATDHEIGRRLRMLVENEPANYYLNFR